MSISVEGDVSQFAEQLARLSDVNKRRLNNVLAEAIRESTLDRFKKGKDPEGASWEESTRVKDLGGKTLVDTAGLKASIHKRAAISGFAVGSNLKYAATHQYGAVDRVITAKTTRGLKFKVGGKYKTKQSVKVTIPARPYLGINYEDLAEIRDTIGEFLMEE